MIAYHGLPLTPVDQMVPAMPRHHAMVSYANRAQIETAAEVCQSIVLENGAFSAWTDGRDPDFDGYRAWVAHWSRHSAVDWHVIPDRIDGTEAQNDDLMAALLFAPGISVPVYHFHESLQRLERLTSYPRIALGSSGQYAEVGTRAWWARMQEIMEVVCDSEDFSRVKLHGLRMLDPQVFSHVPLASTGSTNVPRNIGIDKAWTGPYVPKSRWDERS